MAVTILFQELICICPLTFTKLSFIIIIFNISHLYVTELQTATLLPYSIGQATSKKTQRVRISEPMHYKVLVSKTM